MSDYPKEYDITEWECARCDGWCEMSTDAAVPWWGNPSRVVPCEECKGKGIVYA